MKRGNDGEKIMGPMFPRLHINDTEKGGPRAPPRNKMALYEQLSIPSQRFSHAAMPHNPTSNATSSVPPSSLVGGNDRGMFGTRQVHPSYPSEKQYSQTSELSTSLAQVEQRNKIDEDDYTVPVFIQPIPAEFDKYSNGFSKEKLSPSNPPYLYPSLKFQLAKETDMNETSIGQGGGSKKREKSNDSIDGQKQTVPSTSQEPGVNLTNSVDRFSADDSGQLEICAESRLSGNSQSTAATGANMTAASKRNSSISEEALQSGDPHVVHDLTYDSGSGEDGSCRSLQAGNLERGDSVSETSILDSESALEITPDDVVGIIGQKLFWKARRAIMKILIPRNEEIYFFSHL